MCPEIKVGGSDVVLYRLSYRRKRRTGLEPATAPLTVEVGPAFAPGRIHCNPRHRQPQRITASRREAAPPPALGRGGAVVTAVAARLPWCRSWAAVAAPGRARAAAPPPPCPPGCPCPPRTCPGSARPHCGAGCSSGVGIVTPTGIGGAVGRGPDSGRRRETRTARVRAGWSGTCSGSSRHCPGCIRM